MADKTITALTGASTPLAGTEVLPIVQSGATVKVATNDLTVRNVRANATTGILQVVGPTTGTTRVMTTPDANFTAARTDAAQSFTGDQTLATGNAIQGTAAKGINFTANTSAAGMTSRLLNWYEEGTWTPSVGGDATYTTQTGKYTRIGRVVTFSFVITINAIGTGSDGTISGLPYGASPNGSVCFGYVNSLKTNVISIFARVEGTDMILQGFNAAAKDPQIGSFLTSGTQLQGSGSFNI